MQNVGPFTLTQGQATQVPAPSASQIVGLLLQNQSPYICQVNLGGDAPFLQPFTTQLYPIVNNQAGGVTVTPILALDGANLDNQLLASWIGPTDNLAGSYPASNPVQALTSQVAQVPLLKQAVTSNGSTNVPVPANVNAILISGGIVSGVPYGFSVQILGADDSIVWEGRPLANAVFINNPTGGPNGETSGWVVPIAPGIHSPLNVTWSTGGTSGNMALSLTGLTGPVPASAPPPGVGAVATAAGISGSLVPVLATDSVGRSYEIWSAVVVAGPSGFAYVTINNGGSPGILAAGAPSGNNQTETIAFTVPIIAQNVQLGGSGAGNLCSVSYRYHT